MGDGDRLSSRSEARDDEVRVHMDDPAGGDRIARAILRLSADASRKGDGLVLLCIGTDRSIGDALGPLAGSLLADQGPWPFAVYGTLDQPVHAGNLAEAVATIHREFKRPFVVAVDACLGRSESIGYVTVGRGALKPGAGVNKNLPAVGDLYITGVVNVGGFMEYFVLQNTRLNLVMRMAKAVAAGVSSALSTLAQEMRAAMT